MANGMSKIFEKLSSLQGKSHLYRHIDLSVVTVPDFLFISMAQ